MFQWVGDGGGLEYTAKRKNTFKAVRGIIDTDVFRRVLIYHRAGGGDGMVGCRWRRAIRGGHFFSVQTAIEDVISDIDRAEPSGKKFVTEMKNEVRTSHFYND